MNFIKNLINKQVITILKPTLDEYNSTLLKAIDCKEPFFKDKKDEFKDALIWSSIISKLPTIKNEKNYLLTNNTHDFWNHKNDGLHSELEKESNGKVEVFTSFKSLFDKVPELLEMKESEEFRKWYEAQDISLDLISKAIEKYLWNHIDGPFKNLISKINISELYPEIELGYIRPEIRKENLVLKEIKSQTVKGSYVDIAIGLTIGYEAVANLPNFKKGDLSIIEHIWIESELQLNCAYDKDELFRPIEFEIKSSQII